MRVTNVAIVLVGVASAYTPLLSSKAPAKVCDVTTYTVYETAYAAKGTPIFAEEIATATRSKVDRVKATPSAKVGETYISTDSNQQDDFVHTGDHLKLKSCAAPSQNVNSPRLLEPVIVGEKTQIFYAENGETDATKKFTFGVVELLFKAPAVVLEQSSYITNVQYTRGQFVVDFSSGLACDYAMSSWAKGTILVSGAAGCQTSTTDDQCYFQIDTLVRSSDGKSIIATGKAQSQEECTTGGAAHWGVYKPSGKKPDNPVRNGTTGANGTWTGSNTHTPGASQPTPVSNSPATNTTGPPLSSTPAFNASDSVSVTFGNTTDCVAPADSKYNLPTMCISDYFDVDLDEFIGHSDLSAADKLFLQEATTGLHLDDVDVGGNSTMEQRDLHRRIVVLGLANKLLNKNKKIKKIKDLLPISKVGNFAEKTLDTGVKFVTTGKIDHSIKLNAAFGFPKGKAKNILKMLSTIVTNSPFKDTSILLMKYPRAGDSTKVEKPTNKKKGGVEKEAQLRIFCVGCGFNVDMELSGSVEWGVKGWGKCEVKFTNNMDFTLGIGVDANAKVSAKLADGKILTVGLPGLSFGVVTIGPMLKVDYKLTLEANAQGTILVGGELKWLASTATLDLLSPGKSGVKNFKPHFTPKFEAEGELALGVELGFPVGLHFGVEVGKNTKSIALVTEPSLKAVAKASVSAELENGKFKSKFGGDCKGIHVSLNILNRVYGKVGDKEYDIHKAEDELTGKCIELKTSTRKRLATSMRLDARQEDSSDAATLDSASEVNGADTSIQVPEYPVLDVASKPFDLENGYQFTRLLAQGSEYSLMACSSGNVFIKKSVEKSPDECDDLFAFTENEKIAVADSAGRYFHFHQDSMQAAGVSRLRLGDYESSLTGTTALALVPWNAADAGETPDSTTEGLYFAVDPTALEIYWLVICTYKGDLAPKVFVVNDAEEGIKVLESSDVKYSITGGDIDQCYTLLTKKDPGSMDAWASLEDDLVNVPSETTEAS